MDRQRQRTTLGGDPAHENVFRCSSLESKTEPNVAKAHDYIGGTPHRKNVYWNGGPPHILSMGGTFGVGKKHIKGESKKPH